MNETDNAAQQKFLLVQQTLVLHAPMLKQGVHKLTLSFWPRHMWTLMWEATGYQLFARFNSMTYCFHLA